MADYTPDEMASLALASETPNRKHGQRCPVATRAAATDQCDCWVWINARATVAFLRSRGYEIRPSRTPTYGAEG